MAKTNFTKAEEALAEALQKLTIEQLLEEADAHRAPANPSAEQSDKMAKARLHIVKGLQRELKRLHRDNPDIYKTLEIKRKNLDKLMEDPGKLNPEEWDLIVAAKAKVDAHLKEIATKGASNEQLVESERHKHINKRFNVNDRWLPLK